MLVGTNGERKHKKVATAVATAFISEKPFEKAQVDHIDRNRRNNNVDNLRWVSNKENSRNTRRNCLFTIDGNTKCISEWCEVYGAPYLRVKARVYRGWDIETALTEPSRK